MVIGMRKYTCKKILSACLTGIMILSLTACGNKLEKDLEKARERVAQGEVQDAFSETDDDKKDSGLFADSGSNKFKKYQSGKFAGLLQEDKYFMEYKSYIWGMEGSGKTAVDGKNTSTISEMMGYSTWSLVLDGYEYDFDITQKTYTKTEIADMEDYLNDMQIDYSGLEYVESGNGEIPGMSEIAGYESQNMDYDEYQIVIDMGELASEDSSEMPIPVRLYMDGGELYAIYTQTMGIDSVMMIETLSKNIPKEMFEIPGDYTEVDSLY